MTTNIWVLFALSIGKFVSSCNWHHSNAVSFVFRYVYVGTSKLRECFTCVVFPLMSLPFYQKGIDHMGLQIFNRLSAYIKTYLTIIRNLNYV